MKLNWKQKAVGYIAIVLFLFSVFQVPWKIEFYDTNGNIYAERNEKTILFQKPMKLNETRLSLDYKLLLMEWLAIGIPAVSLIYLLRSEKED